MEHGTVTTDEELASLYREVQRKVEVQQKKLLLMEGQILVKQQETLTLVEVAANHQERDYVTDEQRYKPQDTTTAREGKCGLGRTILN